MLLLLLTLEHGSTLLLGSVDVLLSHIIYMCMCMRVSCLPDCLPLRFFHATIDNLTLNKPTHARVSGTTAEYLYDSSLQQYS